MSRSLSYNKSLKRTEDPAERPSPSKSATAFEPGTIKTGNDGNKWIVSETVTGVRRWQRLSNDQKPVTRKSKKITVNDLTDQPVTDRLRMQLPQAIRIRKIGSFEVESQVVTGDVSYSELNLRKGMYDAYKIDDNLMIINQNSGIRVTRDIVNWNWRYSGVSISVDSGTFGFFDKIIVDEINYYANNKRSQNTNSLPFINFPEENEFIVNTDMTTTLIRDPKKKKFVYTSIDLPDDLLDIDYGVISGTSTGDGGFDCYTIGRDRAILIGGLTAERLYPELA